MNDEATLLNLINSLIIREIRGGSNTLLLEHLKYVESGVDGHIQATPGLTSFLWNKCVEISRIFPNSLTLMSSEPDFSQDLKLIIGNHQIAYQSTLADPIVEAVTGLVTGIEARLSLSDLSWLKTGLNRYFKSGIKEINYRDISCYLDHPIDLYLPHLASWQSKGWLSLYALESSDPEKILIRMKEYIDREEPLF